MASFAPFKLSLQEPGNSSFTQLKIWIDELDSYEHELLMEIKRLSQMVRKQYTAAASAVVRHYKALLSDVKQIKEMFERQENDIKPNDSSKHPLKRVAR